MDFVELGRAYSVGVPELDKQHEELAKRLNEAIKHCTGKKAAEKAFYDKNTETSIDILKNHFKTEEKILSKVKYDHFDKHKSDHKEILSKLTKMHDDIKKKRVELDLFYVTAFIKEAVMKHMRMYDLTSKQYFHEGYEKIAKNAHQVKKE